MNLIFLGPPGSGKGTQSQIIAQKYKLAKLSSGDLLRDVAKTDTKIGVEVKTMLEAGILVSDEQIIDIISNKIQDKDCKNGFILDGFPRTLSQAVALEAILQNTKNNVQYVIELYINDNLLIDRICNRFNCNRCSTSFNYKTKPTKQLGICDYCGSDEFSIRTDDTPKTFKDRLETYHKMTLPLKNFYKNKNILYSIDATKLEQDITKKIMNIIDKK